jgi:hypothetical protein
MVGYTLYLFKGIYLNELSDKRCIWIEKHKIIYIKYINKTLIMPCSHSELILKLWKSEHISMPEALIETAVDVI